WIRSNPRSPVTWMPRSAAMVCWPIVVNLLGEGMTDTEQHDSVQVFVGVDVGKGAHHAVALDRKGKRLLDSALPNDETKLRALIGKLKEHGQVLLVVDPRHRGSTSGRRGAHDR